MSVQRPAVKYFGAKWVLAPWLISHFPDHKVYTESFGGGASVLLRKERAYCEVYNDLDHDIVNLFRCIRNPVLAAELERVCRATPYSREEFKTAYEASADPVECARRTLVRAFMGFGSNGVSSKTGFKAMGIRSGSHQAQQWVDWPNHIKSFTERMMGVVIEHKDAKEVMSQQDTPETLHFVDPPYVTDTRVVKSGYKFEMTNEEHRELCTFLSSLNGMVILCGYPNEIYDALGWEYRDREAHADGSSDRIERIWLNPSCARAQSQQSLFGVVNG